ncbi:MAG: hypothetical protein JWQ49_5108 [Edaphobacter sp.]|nr:hypothetical protein [Edaphobacter sp.]
MMIAADPRDSVLLRLEQGPFRVFLRGAYESRCSSPTSKLLRCLAPDTLNHSLVVQQYEISNGLDGY